MSPFAGVLGAVPWGALNDAMDVVHAGATIFERHVIADADASTIFTLFTLRSDVATLDAFATTFPDP